MNSSERAELLPAFLSEASTDLGTLRAGVANLPAAAAAGGDDQQLTTLSIVAHRMRGSAGLYGFPQLAKMAGLLERILEARPDLNGAQGDTYVTLVGTAVHMIGVGLDDITHGRRETDLGLRFSRAGGAAQLQAVLRAQPHAFVPRSTQHIPDDLDDAADLQPAAAGSLPDTLRAFVREQAEVWEYFAPEVREHLGHLSAQLDAPEPDLDVTFRAAHTIKGSSFMVGLEPLGEFAHRLEDVLGGVRDGLLRIDTPLRDELRRGTDLMTAMLRVAEGADEPVQEQLEIQAARLALVAQGESGVPAPASAAPPADLPVASPELATMRVPARHLEGLIDQMGALVTSRSRLGQSLGRLDELQRAMQDSQERFGRAVRDFEERYLNADMLRVAEGTRPERAGPALAEDFNELELDTYSDLNILARSITELSADFSEVRRRLEAAVSDLHAEHEDMGKLLRRLRVDVTQTARVPFSQVTARLRRWAREHRDRLEFVTRGDDLKVDSATLQRLGEPLLHLLTNALHHGLGTPEDRAAAGKAPRGRVELSATLVGSFLEITVRDDGRGLDFLAIRERALMRGLRSAQELNAMEDDEVARLILLPGLSTEQQVSTVAGRGVGMDVVATTTRQLGGELLIRSRAGEGTTFTMRLPTTRRIMDVLQVQVGTVPLAFAVASVRALRELREPELRIGEGGFEAPFEGRWIPVVDLRELWGTPATGETFSLVVLSTLAGEVAARVDTFGTIGESSVAPTGSLLGALDYLSGTALSATGEVLPLLEPQGLLRLARRPDLWLSHERTGEQATVQGRLLLVDDSLSVRRVVGRMLERAGFTVDTANDGQDAYERLQQGVPYDVVLSDLEMPRMNGFELLSALRGRPTTASLPVVIMTTRAGEKHQRLAFSLGATDYFTKPVNEALLLRRVGRLTGAVV
ncbi:hybrid sensor histidine kinase/response regulator [uncultured Deinococcus sp.]|uniref:hybrid sensor histidine kinase/response regulator n=1 Tax=uncultured Deinococcus sp. TaxID=158789 RepID=UPI0025D08A86|nr:hybrid sensor histidine kinase/response regulator [uncultured Deinococcus sp.]